MTKLKRKYVKIFSLHIIICLLQEGVIITMAISVPLEASDLAAAHTGALPLMCQQKISQYFLPIFLATVFNIFQYFSQYFHSCVNRRSPNIFSKHLTIFFNISPNISSHGSIEDLPIFSSQYFAQYFRFLIFF